MPLVDLTAAPSESMRRWFGLSLGCVLLILAFLFTSSGWLRIVSASTAGLVAFVYYAFPQSQLPIIRGWQFITYPIAWVVGHLLFGVVFFLIVTPLGLLLRAFRYDPLRLRTTDDDDASQWLDRPSNSESANGNSDRYFRQF